MRKKEMLYDTDGLEGWRHPVYFSKDDRIRIKKKLEQEIQEEKDILKIWLIVLILFSIGMICYTGEIVTEALKDRICYSAIAFLCLLLTYASANGIIHRLNMEKHLEAGKYEIMYCTLTGIDMDPETKECEARVQDPAGRETVDHYRIDSDEEYDVWKTDSDRPFVLARVRDKGAECTIVTNID